jgi:hypothetical protein
MNIAKGTWFNGNQLVSNMKLGHIVQMMKMLLKLE